MKVIFNAISRELEVFFHEPESDTLIQESHFFEETDEWYFPENAKGDIRIHFHYEEVGQLLVYQMLENTDLALLDSWNSPSTEADFNGGMDNLKIVFSDKQRSELEGWIIGKL